MSDREQAIDQEVRALWRTLRPDPPPEHLSGGELLEVLLRLSPDVRYDRIVSPYLREGQITQPRPAPRL